MNYKIKVNNEAESKEAQGLFFELGYEWKYKNIGKNYHADSSIGFLYADNGCITTGDKDNGCDYFEYSTGEYKPLTLPQLRDLVVLKRNSIDDATHVDKDGEPWFASSDNKFHSWADDHWAQERKNVVSNYNPKPIEKPMKEYLNPNQDYKLVTCGVGETSIPEDWINVPGGAIKATLCNDFLIFWKDDFLSLSQKNGDTDFTFDEKEDYGFVEYMDINDDAKLIWKRETLNDKVASAECFRKSFAPNSNEIAKAIVSSLNDEDKFLNEVESHLIDNVNHPSHYASGEIECIDAMRAMLGREQFIGYIRGNIFKYQWRYQNKNGIEDLKKSQWYLSKLLEVENEL